MIKLPQRRRRQRDERMGRDLSPERNYTLPVHDPRRQLDGRRHLCRANYVSLRDRKPLFFLSLTFLTTTGRLRLLGLLQPLHLRRMAKLRIQPRPLFRRQFLLPIPHWKSSRRRLRAGNARPSEQPYPGLLWQPNQYHARQQHCHFPLEPIFIL